MRQHWQLYTRQSCRFIQWMWATLGSYIVDCADYKYRDLLILHPSHRQLSFLPASSSSFAILREHFETKPVLHISNIFFIYIFLCAIREGHKMNNDFTYINGERERIKEKLYKYKASKKRHI